MGGLIDPMYALHGKKHERLSTIPESFSCTAGETSAVAEEIFNHWSLEVADLKLSRLWEAGLDVHSA